MTPPTVYCKSGGVTAGSTVRSCGGAFMYLVSRDGTSGCKLVAITAAGGIAWSVDLPNSSSTSADPDLTINANGIYTAHQDDGSNDNIHRWTRAGAQLESARRNGTGTDDVGIASNTLGDVFAVGNFTNTTKYEADLTVALTGNTDSKPNLRSSYMRRMACAADGDLYVAKLQAGAGGGHARGWRASDLGFYGGTGDPHVLGVRESLVTSRTYWGSAPSFTTNAGVDFGMSMSSRQGFEASFQPGRGKGIDTFTGLLVSETIGSARTRGATFFGKTPTYITTTGGTHSYFPSGTKLEHYDDIDDGGGPAVVVWSEEAEDIFTGLPTGASIENIPYGVMPDASGTYGYAWGVSYNTSTNALDAWVGRMNLATQTQDWLLLNSDTAVNGIFGLTSAPNGSFDGFAITAAVLDQDGEGYSDPDIF